MRSLPQMPQAWTSTRASRGPQGAKSTRSSDMLPGEWTRTCRVVGNGGTDVMRPRDYAQRCRRTRSVWCPGNGVGTALPRINGPPNLRSIRVGGCGAARNGAGSEILLYTAARELTYVRSMKRLQIYIEEEMDRALGVEARRTRKSKAALIREYVAERLRQPGPDPVDAFIGSFDGGADLSASVDDVLYGKRE